MKDPAQRREELYDKIIFVFVDDWLNGSCYSNIVCVYGEASCEKRWSGDDKLVRARIMSSFIGYSSIQHSLLRKSEWMLTGYLRKKHQTNPTIQVISNAINTCLSS